MDFTLIQATQDHASVIDNLMQFYNYDFSEFIKHDVNNMGLFEPYSNLDKYWEENNKFPYVIKIDNKYAGFVLVKFIKSESRNYFSMAEFFVLKKYRLDGIGKAVAIQIFNLHQGKWEVYQKESNRPAQIFWTKVINEYTKGKFIERFEEGKYIQDFESN